MNISVVVTVLNEEESIAPLLNSLYKQTLLPLELIVVDGGSTDQTKQKVEHFAAKHSKLTIRLIEEEGNISHGRNIGISQAKGNIIAMTDAGCRAKKDWLQKLVLPFKDSKVGLVAGFYEMETKNVIEKAVAPFHGVPLRRFDPRNYLPSARSIAFRKQVWAEVGGFSENLIRAGEDTLFNYAVLKKGITIVRCPEAMVYWNVPDTLRETIKKFYWYAKGDAQTGIWWHPAKKWRTHNIKILTIFWRYFVLMFLLLASAVSSFAFFLFIVVFVAYTFWSIWKLHQDIDDTRALLLVPVIQIASDISIMFGFLSGLFLTRHPRIIRNELHS